MGLKPELSLGASLAVMALDFGIFTLHLPPSADVRASDPHNQAIDGGRKAAIWTAVGASSALSLMAKDPNIFIFGAGFAVALDWYFRHANAVSPQTGKVSIPPGPMTPGGYDAGGG